MPDIGKALKDEIARIAKREANSLLDVHIKTIRNLKLEVSALKKQIGKPAVTPPADAKAATTEKPEGKSTRFTSKGIMSMRKRLGLNRSKMAQLCGVTPKAVMLWEEAGPGKLNLRSKTRIRLLEVRDMSPTAARKVLAGN
jgi:DNA-binding transcriptional regulator YiaG